LCYFLSEKESNQRNPVEIGTRESIADAAVRCGAFRATKYASIDSFPFALSSADFGLARNIKCFQRSLPLKINLISLIYCDWRMSICILMSDY
jgi:hypothetical protein